MVKTVGVPQKRSLTLGHSGRGPASDLTPHMVRPLTMALRHVPSPDPFRSESHQALDPSQQQHLLLLVSRMLHHSFSIQAPFGGIDKREAKISFSR